MDGVVSQMRLGIKVVVGAVAVDTIINHSKQESQSSLNRYIHI